MEMLPAEKLIDGNNQSFAENFFIYPKRLVDIQIYTYQQLCSEARIVYVTMFDALRLNIKRGVIDEVGRPYIYFALAQVQRMLGCGESKATKIMKQLESCGLVYTQRQRGGMLARRYLSYPIPGPYVADAAGMNVADAVGMNVADAAGMNVADAAGMNVADAADKYVYNNNNKRICNNTSPITTYAEVASQIDAERLVGLFDRELVSLTVESMLAAINGEAILPQSAPVDAVERLLDIDSDTAEYALDQYLKKDNIKSPQRYMLQLLCNARSNAGLHYAAQYTRNEMR